MEAGWERAHTYNGTRRSPKVHLPPLSLSRWKHFGAGQIDTTWGEMHVMRKQPKCLLSNAPQKACSKTPFMHIYHQASAYIYFTISMATWGVHGPVSCLQQPTIPSLWSSTQACNVFFPLEKYPIHSFPSGYRRRCNLTWAAERRTEG